MNNKISLSTVFRFIGCLIFDIAVIIAFFQTFSLFTVLMPIKSILMLLFLLLGIVTLNVAIAFPRVVFDKVGIPYSTSIIVLFILYAVSANVLSAFLIVGSITGYIVWELILFAVFLLVLSFLVSFARKASENTEKVQQEQSAKISINLQLVRIETAINAMDYNNSALSDSYQALKERLNASTPFERVTDNQAVTDVENMIKANLQNILSCISTDSEEKEVASIQKQLDNTRQLLINRERLIVK